jgi:hypothetical protein
MVVVVRQIEVMPSSKGHARWSPSFYLDPETATNKTAGAFFFRFRQLADRKTLGRVATHRRKSFLTNNLNAICATCPLQIFRLGSPDKAKRLVQFQSEPLRVAASLEASFQDQTTSRRVNHSKRIVGCDVMDREH